MNDRPFVSEKLLNRQSSAAEDQRLPLAPVPTHQQGRPAMTRLATVGQGGRLPNRPSAPNGVPSPGSGGGVGVGGGGSGSTDTTSPSVMAALLNHSNLVSPLSSSSPTSSNSRKRKLPPEDSAFGKVIDFQASELKRLKTAYVGKMGVIYYVTNKNPLDEYDDWRSKPPFHQLVNFFKSHNLNTDDVNEDLSEVYQSTGPGTGTATPPPPSSIQIQKLADVRESILPSSLPTPRVQLTPLKSQTLSAVLKSYTSPPASTPSQQPRQEEQSQSSQGGQGDGNNRGAINQEQIVERAKQEAYVMQRIGELQKDGLWAERRLPKVHELPRAKAHWDYLLEEMAWLAADFAQERKWKKAAAKKCARMVQKYFQDKEAMAQKAIRAQELQLKKTASFMAREVKQFWANVEKLVEFKQQIRLEEKRKKALDQHLSFIVDQTEKYSSLVAESMNTTVASQPAKDNSQKHSDVEFEPEGSSDDDEETIAKEEALSAADKDKVSEEIEALQREGELPLEELLPDYLEKRDSIIVSPPPSESSADDDEEFKAPDKESEDDEETINEQEKAEKSDDHENELDELKALGEMDIEELKAKYNVGRTPSEPKVGKKTEEVKGVIKLDSDDDSSEDDEGDEDADDVDVENSDSEEEEEEDDENESTLEEEDSVLKSLLVEEGKSDDADKEMNDVAAIAESLQPKGNTLSSTKVVTKVPFLLKHSLREYQHIGLDWLVTMYDRNLNGILADEMGLGKTIQTIALLAHLACVKENWGPHLIVVPTSVMLNWEMEFKKWCPAFKILTYFGSQKERKLKRSGWTKPNAFHVCITSYKLVIQDHQSFRRKKWKYLILDEAQNIKNFKSQRWQLLLNFQTQRRLLLTGTPLQNNLMELWSLMHFLMPNVFESHREFKEWFSNPVTGMIEGNSEYNENIIKRLHKVLRPFLLRRLKSEVETQMPKKYEHVVMCRLSNRQRYLYDDFMSRTKTKETLASGNYLSVINVLMQLRKVCNHPNLFETRQTVSPFQMEGLTCQVPSHVFNALDYDPFKHVDLSSLNLSFIENELSISAYSAIRGKQLKTRRAKIQNIDSAPPPSPKCPKARLKIAIKGCSTLPPIAQKLQQQLSSSPQGRLIAQQTQINNHKLIQVATKVGTSPVVKTIVAGQNSGQVVFRLASNTNSSVPNYVQLLHQPGGGVKAISLSGTQVVKSDGSTVTRVLPPFAQVVNTSSGRQLVLSGQQFIASQAGGTTLTTSTGQRLTVVSKPGSNVAKLVSPGIAQMNPVRPAVRVPSISIPGSGVTTQNCVTTSVTTSAVNAASPNAKVIASPVFVTNVVASPTSSPTKTPPMTKPSTSPVSGKRPQTLEKPIPKVVESSLHDKELADKIKNARTAKLGIIARINDRRCDRYPIFGEDLAKAVTRMDPQVTPATSEKQNQVALSKHSPSKLNWRWAGHDHCERALLRLHPKPDVYWSETEALKQAIYSVEDRVAQLGDLFQRFILYVPAVAAPAIDLRVPHPPPWRVAEEKRREELLFTKMKPKARLFHQIVSAMATQFPDPRLIQYDCGKLQSLDRLLRDLKQDHHRVLIFTQMTKMLDVLESFLNFHGHIYLRLDGSTRVDQRQVLMERFNADKRIFCFILSTRSGGVGVNLTGADTVIFYDSDWNPTMDAQAQDRCHRIGQTRDVHIYRLISDKTIEENILKKANQKRMLGDLAIEGGNFTTAYFKKSTIQDLFNVDQSENEASQRLADILGKDAESKKPEIVVSEGTQQDAEKAALGALESALAEAEDDTDVAATRVVRAEAAAELAEFDENIPLDTPQEPEMSKAEIELNALMQQLNGVEKYAMKFMEEIEPAFSAEQLAAVEAEIESQKREWELAMLRDEENKLNRSGVVNSRGGSDSDSEDVITFSGSDARNQYWISDDGKEMMPIWCPPTPPQDGSDVYIDRSLDYLYERTVMFESQLPPVHIKKDKKRTRIEAGLPDGGRLPLKVKPREETLIHSAPRSLFDRPSPAVIKMRQELRLQRYRGLMRPTSIQHILKSSSSPKPTLAQEPDHILDWIIQEDWAILQAVQQIQELPVSVIVLSPGQTPNWDFVADFVNHTSRTYRSPKQCRIRYDNVIMPREEGKLVLDSPKKQKKTKTVYKLPQVKAGRPMRTSQLYSQDNNTTITQIMNTRFEAIRAVSNRRTPTVKPLLVDPTIKNPKHSDVLTEGNIEFDKPLTPVQVAARRADRIAKEKLLSVQVKNSTVTEQQLAALRQQQLQQQLAAQQLAAAQQQQQQAVQQQMQPQIQSNTLKMASITVPTVVSNVMTVPSSATVTRAVTVQVRSGGEILASPGTTRTIITSSPSSSPLPTAQQRQVAANVVAVQSPITAAAAKGTKISAAQLQLLRQQQQTQMIRQQQQQLRVLHARPPGQKVPVAVAGAGSPGVQRVQQVKAGVTTRTVTEPEMMALLKRQQANKVPVSAAALTSAQLLAQAGLQTQQASTSGTISQVATLVKTVPASSVPLTGLSLPQVRMKAALGPGMKTNTVTPQQIRQISLQQQQQLLAQQRKMPQQKVTQLSQVATKGGTTQLIVQSQKALPTTMTMQQIQQVMKHVQPQQVITAQGTTAQVLSPHVFKSQAGGPQARVIPVVSAGQTPIKQAIQVVASTAGTPVTTRTVPTSVTIDASGRSQTTALTGTIKAGSASQAAILTQVSAVLQQQGQPITVRQPVRIQASSTPLVAVSMAAVAQTPTVLTLPPQQPSDNNQQPQ